MAVIKHYPVSYYPASHSGIYDSIVTNGGTFTVPDDPVNAPGGSRSSFGARDLFAPWFTDVYAVDSPNSDMWYAAVIFIVNDTGSELTLNEDSSYKSSELISKPILPPPHDSTGIIPAGYKTDRGTYLGMGRFVQGHGGVLYGAGACLTFDTTIFGKDQSFGIFVSTSEAGSLGMGLDICADMSGVDPKTRLNEKAGKSETPCYTSLSDTSGVISIKAALTTRMSQHDIESVTMAQPSYVPNHSPLVFVHIAGA